MSDRRRARAALARRGTTAGVPLADDSVRGALAGRYADRLATVAEGTTIHSYYRTRLEAVTNGEPVTFYGWELRGHGLHIRQTYTLTGADEVALY